MRLGRTADEQKYAELFEKIRAAFEKQFVHDDGFVAGADNTPSPFGQINNPNAKSKGGDTQTGYVLALHMNLVPEDAARGSGKEAGRQDRSQSRAAGYGFSGHSVSAGGT